MNMNFNFNNPTNLIFGAGKLNELGSHIAARRAVGSLGKKALLLISNGKSVKTYGTLERVEEQLKEAEVEYVVCANIHENPSKEVVMEAAAAAKENSCDFIVALGGGAVMGLCKRRYRQRKTACKSRASYRNYCNIFRHRLGGQLLGRYLQSSD